MIPNFALNILFAKTLFSGIAYVIVLGLNAIAFSPLIETIPEEAQNSIIEGNDDDTNGNIDATDISVSDIFNAPTNGDYSLKEGSFVVVNKGDNTLYTNVNGNLTLVDDVDLAGNARLFRSMDGRCCCTKSHRYRINGITVS